MNKTNQRIYMGGRRCGNAALKRLRDELQRRNFVIGKDDGWIIVPKERRAEFDFLLDSMAENQENQEEQEVKNGSD